MAQFTTQTAVRYRENVKGGQCSRNGDHPLVLLQPCWRQITLDDQEADCAE